MVSGTIFWLRRNALVSMIFLFKKIFCVVVFYLLTLYWNNDLCHVLVVDFKGNKYSDYDYIVAV